MSTRDWTFDLALPLPPMRVSLPPNTYDAIVIDGDTCASVVMEPDTLFRHMLTMVSDPAATCLQVNDTIGFWVGKDSADHFDRSPAANYVLERMLSDIAVGAYPDTEETRLAAVARFAGPGVPVLHGPCVITGMGLDERVLAPLSAVFWDWFEPVQEVMDQLRAGHQFAGFLRDQEIPVRSIVSVTIRSE
ncbi:hypothetical protein CLV68_5231 [Actinokineospora cianjurensis]|uniref:Uncharacterized protein n=1 Tax=Actinokineospora cianjurensis TaxID=585224 RepID=A0A421AYA1_9PSEU|nr:hypothetical protein CLV68_5231 [Actinokineospora cianjurensis]